MDRSHHRLRGFTLIELMISVTIFLVLAGLATYVFLNVSKAVDRTMAIIHLHHEAASVLQRLEEDLLNLQPNAAINLDQHHLTFVRTHGEALGLETVHGGTKKGAYAHDLVWVRWQWDPVTLRRSVTPRMPVVEDEVVFFNNQDSNNPDSSGSGRADGVSIAPQQFYEYFEPPSLPDRSDPTVDQTTLASQTSVFISSLAPVGARSLETGIYWRPSKVWWFPGSSAGYGRVAPGTPTQLEFGMLTEEAGTDPITGITWKPSDPYHGETADAPHAGFAMVNSRGYSVNRDYMNLVGAHPDDPYQEPYPSRLALISDRVMNLRVALLANEYRADGSLQVWGGTKSAHFRGDAALGTGAFAGLPMNPSADNKLGVGGLQAGRLPELTRSRDFNQHPVKAEISFVIHTVPRKEDDALDYDGDGDLAERLVQAVYDALSAAVAPDPVADADLVRALEDLGYVAVPFVHIVDLP